MAARSPRSPACLKATAHVGYLPSAVRCSGGPVIREKYHVIPDQAIPVRGREISDGYIWVRCLNSYEVPAGEPLCGAVGLVFDPDPGLFGPIVNCPTCVKLAAENGVTLTDGQLVAASLPLACR